MDIETNVKEVISGAVEIEIFVPEGEEISKNTVLPMLGIEGGIPIFGTTGFIEPYTKDGYKRVITTLISGKNELLGVGTGEKSSRIAVEKLDFPIDKIVIAGDLVCYAVEKSKAKKKVIFAMPAEICDLLEIDARALLDFEFGSVSEFSERPKSADYERLKSFFQTLAEDLARKTGADVYVFYNSGETLGSFISSP